MALPRLVFALTLGSVLALTLPSVASAFTVTPIRLELAGDPGSPVSSEFRVYNDTNQTQTFYTSVQNFETQDETGNPVFVDSSTGLASWISAVPSVTVKPREEVAIPFKINIPSNAEPGGYFAGLFASTAVPGATGSNVELGSRIGTLLLLRVNGDIAEGVNVLEFGTANHHRFFSRLPILFYYRFQNSGADRVKPLGDVIIKNIFTRVSKILNANLVDGNVLPKSIRRFETPWVTGARQGETETAAMPTTAPSGFFGSAKAEWTNFALGPYVAHLNVVYGNTTTQNATDSYLFFVFPWHLLLIILVIVVVLLFVLRVVLRRYNRYIIAQAKRKH